MKFAGFVIVLIFTPILFFSYNRQVFSQGFFKLFDNTEFSETGLRKVMDFNPENDTLYLPGLENKELFESIKDLSLCRNEEVRKYIYLYLTTGREYIIKSIERSGIYIDIINDIIKKNPDIPSEIALLPLLESGFDPNAVSKSNAVGLWQFLQSTSSHLDIKSNKWVEERRDIVKSTEAAIRHLRYLHNTFKSWDLALAAYNGGDGQIRRAMLKTDSHDIWKLMKSGALTKETSEYVPRYAALVMIYNNQKMFGIYNDIKPPIKEKTEVIKLTSQQNIDQLSKICNIDVNEIRKYNPELNSLQAPPSELDYSLRLTVKSAQKLNPLNITYEYIFAHSVSEYFVYADSFFTQKLSLDTTLP